MFSALAAGSLNLLDPVNLLVMFVGVAIGIVGGMLPGISVVTTLALFMPFTFSMPATTALIALGAVFCGATYGGANAAILINTPGQPGSIATTFDGYAMTQQGRAEEGLYTALLASAFGGVVGALLLLLFFEPLSGIALKFGSEAFFWMAIFGLTTLAAMSPGNVMKSLLGGCIGLGLSTVGLDPAGGFPRFTFDCYDLVQGLDMVVLMTSLFSFSQMLFLLESGDGYIADLVRRPKAFLTALKGVWACRKLLTLMSCLGCFIGGLPGAGGSVASIITYNEARRWDRNPDRWGTGVIEGVAVPEAANNACVGGSLVPLMALGIPGSASAAILMGGLLSQGLTPGPQLLENNADVAYTFISSLIFVNIVMVLVGWVLVKVCSRILDVPKLVIIPTVITLSILGAYSLRNSMFDVLVLLLTGGGAYLCLKARISPASIALGVVLGPIIEEALSTTIMRSYSSSLPDLLVFSPMSLLFITLSAVSLLVPVYLARRKGGAGSGGSWKPSARNVLRYDFLAALVCTLAGMFFIGESLELTGVAGIFPLVVFSCVAALGLIVLAQELGKRAVKADRVNYVNVVLYFAFAMLTWFLVEPLGFYTALFVCMVIMLCYGTFAVRRHALTAGNAARCLLLGAGITFAEYACFAWLLHVPTPVGLWI